MTCIARRRLLWMLLFSASVVASTAAKALAADRPNVLLIMTDDQGYGDLGVHGNPKIRTPVIDRLASESVVLERFYVCPVCSPTRACLMTGRYNYRTGVVDTFLGRSMMHPDEVTIAEMLGAAGYRTGIFGKWHLGDNYPLRPIDQGFQESLVHKGGGIAQPADPPEGNSYFDPILFHNGEKVQTKGYCSDVYVDAVIEFIEEDRERPFFVYLPFNCPHTPLQVPDEYYLPYKESNLADSEFPAIGNGPGGAGHEDETARVYGMVTNIDDNLGRLFARLEQLGIDRDTMIVFLTDNGPQQPRYRAGLRERKGSVYEGGIRVPCFVRWTGTLEAGHVVPRACAHIDLTPTILAACGVEAPSDVAFDGLNLLPWLRGEDAAFPARTLFFQWHRGDEPELFRAFAARGAQYKLLRAEPRGRAPEGGPRFELYDLDEDPYEMHELAEARPEIVARLKQDYERWFQDVGARRGYDPPRIHLGTPHENPVILSRQDWRGPQATWGAAGIGFWEVLVAEPGLFDVTLLFDAVPTETVARLKFGSLEIELPVDQESTSCIFHDVDLTQGPGRLEPSLVADGKRWGVRYAEVNRVEAE